MRYAKQVLGILLPFVGAISWAQAADPTPQQTLQAAAQVLEDTRALRVQAIPDALLADAQAVAVVPSVTKIGLIVGGRHGRGIVVVRDKDGAWTSPSFIELVGGSVGWQVGVQRTDVVLVFKNKQGIDSLLKGNKFTLGADAAVAAGPVGRQASAATDEQLKAEVYSYSRSRGLFAGASLEGCMLSVDAAATASFQQGGEAAAEDVDRLMAALQNAPTVATAALASSSDQKKLLATQAEFRKSSEELNARLPNEWKAYLAIPPEFAEQSTAIPVTEETLKRYDRVAADTKYEALTSTAEFQNTHALLGRYLTELHEANAVALPPPPRD